MNALSSTHKHPSHGTGILNGTLKVNGQPHGSLRPGEPAQLAFEFTQADNGQAVTTFETDHDKFMHTIVVSEDLSHFAHIHPSLGQDGQFRLDINSATTDPDNQDAARTVETPGSHLVFAEVKPAGGESERVAFRLKAEGQAAPVALTPDLIGSGQVTRYFSGDGKLGEEGAPYKVTLALDDMRPMGMMHFNYHLEAKNAENQYENVTDAGNWLGMAGHAVVVGAQGEQPEDRFFNHLHAGGHGGHEGHGGHKEAGQANGPDFQFMLSGEMPQDGKYKVWSQFQRDGQVLTFPFGFELAGARSAS